MLPFIYADTRMAPAGVRSIGSAMVDSGFTKTRIVLQQWNKHFKPSKMRVDGRVPDLFMVSTMGMHSGRAMEMIADVRKMDVKERPLIIAGGSHAVYEPHLLFNGDPNCTGGADVAITGEEFVLLSFLEVLLTMRASGESMRSVFVRARDSGALDGIPGLVYSHGVRDGLAEELVDTGVQRLLGDLDELASPVLGYALLEAPSRGEELREALAANRVRKNTPIGSVVLTFGCKFNCPYCPIPAYNQRQHRLKSPQRIAEEMWGIYKAYGIKNFFGVDDNFFNKKELTIEIIEKLATAEFEGTPLRRVARWYTEVTVHDTLQMKDHLERVHKAGCRALWLGVEDMTATLVNKGQSVDKTSEAFRLMRGVGICPMPMMMHHDTQPLYSPGSNYGLLNQIRVLRKAGAVSLQVLMMTPSPGTKLYEGTFTEGMVIDTAGGKKAEQYMCDGNYIFASKHARPWKKQVNLWLGYLSFYNPVKLAAELVRPRRTKAGMEAGGDAGCRDDGADSIGAAHGGVGAAAEVRKNHTPGASAGVDDPDAECRRDGGVPCAGGDGGGGVGEEVPGGGADGGGVRAVIVAKRI